MNKRVIGKTEQQKGVLTLGWIALGMIVTLFISVLCIGVAEAAPVDDAKMHAKCAVLAEIKGDMVANLNHIRMMQPYAKGHAVEMLVAGIGIGEYVRGFSDGRNVAIEAVAGMAYLAVCNQLVMNDT